VGKKKERKTGFQVRKTQERNMWWGDLNGHRNKFMVPDTKYPAKS
jgi:hypothetical protein